MSIPIFCPKCNEILGELDGLACMLWSPWLEAIMTLGCHGDEPCNHEKPTITERIKSFGFFRKIPLIKEVFWEYPETLTSSSWGEYIGPPDERMLKKAILSTKEYPNGSHDGLRVNGKWARYDCECDQLYGDGANELRNLRDAAKAGTM